jgi:hypothetical protein
MDRQFLTRRWVLFRAIGLAASILAVGLFVAPYAPAEERGSSGAVNGIQGYQRTSSGDPLTGQGAQVTISGEPNAQAAFGWVTYKTSARGWADKVAHLSAVVVSAETGVKPAIWLRTDDSADKPLRTVSSNERAISADGHVSIDVRIPPGATSIAFGVLTRGAGKATMKNLRLEEGVSLPGNEASAERVYEAALKIVLAHAYWANNIPAAQRESGSQLSRDPGTGYQAEKPIRVLLRALGDSHSFYLSAEAANQLSRSGGTPDAAPVKLVEGEVGYVSIPAFTGTDPALEKAFAEEVGGKLRAMRDEARCGWVVDLRKNSGGNMWPMLSALSLFFGEERLGGFKNSAGDINWWSIQSPRVVAVPGASEARNARVAVLLGPRTASSGEAVAVAYVKRENTKSFGAPTRGLASSNRQFKLPDGSSIFLTTSVDVDRSGREVGKRVVPDTQLPDDIVSSPAVPQEALSWLTASCPK